MGIQSLVDEMVSAFTGCQTRLEAGTAEVATKEPQFAQLNQSRMGCRYDEADMLRKLASSQALAEKLKKDVEACMAACNTNLPTAAMCAPGETEVYKDWVKRMDKHFANLDA